MPTPVATIVNTTATGDVILGPGAVTTMVKGLPCACMGDPVAGPVVVTGVITMTTALNKLAKGRPQACIGSVVTGVSAVGIPIASAVAICPNINVIV